MEEKDIELRQMEFIKRSLLSAYIESKTADDILFKNNINEHDQIIASLFINKAISIMSSCKAVYYSNIGKLENSEVEKIFHSFDTYENEFLTNVSTQHSHQWTNIEFENYKDTLSTFINIDY